MCGEISFIVSQLQELQETDFFFFIGPGMPAALLFGISVIPSEIPIESTCALYFPASQGL